MWRNGCLGAYALTRPIAGVRWRTILTFLFHPCAQPEPDFARLLAWPSASWFLKHFDSTSYSPIIGCPASKPRCRTLAAGRSNQPTSYGGRRRHVEIHHHCQSSARVGCPLGACQLLGGTGVPFGCRATHASAAVRRKALSPDRRF